MKLFFTKDQGNSATFLQLDIYGTSWDRERNDVNNLMDVERALHKKRNRIPMALFQKLISSMMRGFLGAWG